MIGKVVTGCVAILPYHTATQDRGSECRDFGFISRIVTALVIGNTQYKSIPFFSPTWKSSGSRLSCRLPRTKARKDNMRESMMLMMARM